MITRWPTPTAGDPFVLTADLVAVVMSSDQHGAIQQQHRVGHAVWSRRRLSAASSTERA